MMKNRIKFLNLNKLYNIKFLNEILLFFFIETNSCVFVFFGVLIIGIIVLIYSKNITLLSIATSFFAALIFYVFTIYIPKRKRIIAFFVYINNNIGYFCSNINDFFNKILIKNNKNLNSFDELFKEGEKNFNNFIKDLKINVVDIINLRATSEEMFNKLIPFGDFCYEALGKMSLIIEYLKQDSIFDRCINAPYPHFLYDIFFLNKNMEYFIDNRIRMIVQEKYQKEFRKRREF